MGKSIQQGCDHGLIPESPCPVGLAFQGDKKIIHTPKYGKFLRARLKPSPDKLPWKLVKLKGWAETERDVYFMDGKKWHMPRAGEVVWGQILGDKIELESIL